MKKHILAIMLAVIAIFTLAACEAAPPEDTRVRTPIMENGATSYVIMRSDTASQGDIDAAIALRSAIEDNTGIKMKLETDWVKRGDPIPEGTLEILVGSTNRPESEKGLLHNDYKWGMENNRIYISGGSDASLMKAVEDFIAQCVSGSGISFPEGGGSFTAEYPMKDATLGGVKLSELEQIVYHGDSLKDYALQLADKLANLVGRKPPVSANYANKDKVIELGCEADDARIVGLAENEVLIKADGGVILAATNGVFYPHSSACELLLSDILENDKYADKLNERIPIMNESITFITEKQLSDYNKQIDARIVEIRAAKDNIKVSGTSYYVSESGDDSNDGLSPEKAWKSIAKVNSAPLKAGDGVFFERGGLFRGGVSAKKGVTYAAYGEGDKPVITVSPFNAAEASRWEATDVENVWKLKEAQDKDIGFILCDDNLQCVKAIIYHNFEGKEGNHIDYTTRKPFKGWQDLDTDLQFFHDLDDKCVYFYSDKGNPGERFESIEMSPRQHGFSIGGNDITIDNLCIKHAGSHGVGAGTVKNLTVTNCEFAWIGGSIQSYTANGDTTPRPTRYGNAVEIYGGCDGFTVDNCYIWQAYDAGITHQYKSQTEMRDMNMKNIRYTNNVLEYCHYSIEFFLDVGPGNDSCISDCIVSDCLMRWAGMGFGEQRPDHGEASHIRGGRGHQNPMAENGFIIKDCLMLESGEHLICAVSNPVNEKYMETSQIVFEGNTYVQFSGERLGYFEINDKSTHYFDATAADYLKSFDPTGTVYYEKKD